MHCQVTFMTLSYFAVMLMFDTFCIPQNWLSSVSVTCTRMSEWQNGWNFVLFAVRKKTYYFFNYVGCQVLRQTVHVNIFVRSQTAINLFENTCEDILNLSKVAGNENNNLPAIQQHFCVAIPDIRHYYYTFLIFQSSFSQKLIKSLSSTLKWWLPI